MNIPTLEKITNLNFINYLTKTILYHWNFKGDPQFPCPQPVSIERKDFEKIKKYDYFVGVKNDGVRYIMFFTIDKNNRKLCILCDRSLNFYTVDIKVNEEVYRGTLFDGEIVKDDKDNYTYIVYDTVCLCGNKTNKNYYESRLAEIDCCIKTMIEPIVNVIKVVPKTFYKFKDFDKFLTYEYDKITNKDGIIFMPNKLPVMTGTQFSMFKWKEKHTVDFLIKYNTEETKNLVAFVYDKKTLIKFANIKHDTPEGRLFIDKFKLLHSDSKETNETILECLFNKETQNFTPLLIRTDKNYPNSLRTVERTLFNAHENITLEEFN